jgi:hypothetical protein
MSCLSNSGIEDSGAERSGTASIVFRAPSPGLAEAVKQTVSYGGCSISPRSSLSSYHRIEVGLEDVTSQRSNVSSSATEAAKKFTCQFDPSVKNGRVLVLRFDTHGVGVFLEMSRSDLLHLAQEAAKPKYEEGEEPEIQSEAPPMGVSNVRVVRRSSVRRVALDNSLGRMGSDNLCGNSVFDVQVCEGTEWFGGAISVRDLIPNVLELVASACARHPQIGCGVRCDQRAVHHHPQASHPHQCRCVDICSYQVWSLKLANLTSPLTL